MRRVLKLRGIFLFGTGSMETRKKVKNVDKKILQSGRVLINNARARSRKGFARGGAVPFRLVANIRASHFEAS